MSYDRERKDFHRQVLLDIMVQRGGCARCQETDVRCLEWNHLGNKKENISAMMGRRPLDILLSEVDKCEVLCSNCHRKYTCQQEKNYKQRYHEQQSNQ